MNSAPISSALLPFSAEGGVVLRVAAERLFRASDAANVFEICDTVLKELRVEGHLHWQAVSDTATAAVSHRIELADDPQGLRALVLDIEPDGPALPDTLREQMIWLGRLASARLRQLAETSRLYEAISRLALAERLQRALYAIAEQAGAEHNMTEMMRSLHAILGSLMYAENFYIVLHDAATGNVRFPYYVDTVDKDPPAPEQSQPLQEMRHSLTWHLLQGGQPIMGSIEELTHQLGEHLRPVGPNCEHWLGVPLLREGHVVGGIVMQSYREDTHYTQHDRELLSYVAQHVQTALERREAHAELQRAEHLVQAVERPLEALRSLRIGHAEDRGDDHVASKAVRQLGEAHRRAKRPVAQRVLGLRHDHVFVAS